MPEEVKNLCRLADIPSKSLLLQIVRQGDPEKMIALIEKLGRDGGATREAVRKETAKPKPGRPKSFVFSYKAPTKAFNLSAEVHQVQSRARRSHLRARSHHPRAPQPEVVRGRHAAGRRHAVDVSRSQLPTCQCSSERATCRCSALGTCRPQLRADAARSESQRADVRRRRHDCGQRVERSRAPREPRVRESAPGVGCTSAPQARRAT